jgi:mannosyltransferase OCH1-like enzyme
MKKVKRFEVTNKNNNTINYNRPYIYCKSNYDSVIPLNIYQTWFTKDLPEKMRERVELLKSQNPEFNHYLFDDNDCREYIKKHFNPHVVEAYDTLIPGAYKADLWRLCVLFINGGIYLDIRFCCTNGFKLIELTEKEHFVKDRPCYSIFNALMVCRKNNIFLYKSIMQIVKNVKNKYYGECSLCPTGPKMLGSVIINNKIGVNVDMNHHNEGGYVIYKNVFVISTEYPEYNYERNLQNNQINKKVYNEMWKNRTIYS